MKARTTPAVSSRGRVVSLLHSTRAAHVSGPDEGTALSARRRPLALPTSLAGCAAVLFALATHGIPQTTLAVSVTAGGTTVDADSGKVKGSPDMRWVVFDSVASNAVHGDVNGCNDVFRRDMATGTTVLASLAGDEGQGTGDSLWPTVSADGRYVAFQSHAANLVAGDANGLPDIFVRDLHAGTTERVNLGPGGVEADGSSRYPMISRDGRVVVFESTASNLVPGDANGCKDVFVRDLVLGTTRRASVGLGGAESDGESGAPTLSPDATRVVFVSFATNLVANDANGAQDVFVAELSTLATACASRSAAGTPGNGNSYDSYLSGDGRIAVFRSEASNLVPGDTNGFQDVFVKDMQTGSITRGSLRHDGSQAGWNCYAPWITADGRHLFFTTEDPGIVAVDTNGTSDVFLRDLATGTLEIVSLGFLGQQSTAASTYPMPSDDARFCVFESVASNLVPGDANGAKDVFLRDRSSSFLVLCAGDGSLATACPCANPGATGRGCDNSASTGGALLVASGTTIPDGVVLHASGELATSLSIFLQGDAAFAAGAVFGDGVRCVGGGLVRLYVRHASSGSADAPAAGEPSVTQRSAELGAPIAVGSQRWYQVYYRDPDASFCPPATFNATNALRVAW